MASTQQTDEILFETQNNAGIITLNRPKSLNALNGPIVTFMLPKLLEWEKTKSLVIIKGAGKAFCAGGDIKKVLEFANNGTTNNDMLQFEYNINHRIHKYKIPYVAFIDGITMGGGLGVSIHGTYRIATENTAASMPETKIGLIPDVGASFFLPRLPNNIGIYLGLTSAVLHGKDVLSAGIATHFVSSHRLPALEQELSKCRCDKEVKETLNQFHESVRDAFSLATHIKEIEYCFAASTVEDIINRLTSINNDWAMNVVKTLRRRCPLALKLTLLAMNRGAHLNLWQCLQMENRLCSRLTEGHNFNEGVRALLIDRNNKPQWIPKTLEEINESDILFYFDPLPEGELVYISSDAKL